MRSATSDLTISTARADALFASPLQRSDQPSPAQVHQAIAAAVAAFGNRGGAARVAQAYGEHPETAVRRNFPTCGRLTPDVAAGRSIARTLKSLLRDLNGSVANSLSVSRFTSPWNFGISEAV